eukprot:scaffold154_cov129-Cylindrotheca_fusiformis.AAC.38
MRKKECSAWFWVNRGVCWGNRAAVQEKEVLGNKETTTTNLQAITGKFCSRLTIYYCPSQVIAK